MLGHLKSFIKCIISISFIYCSLEYLSTAYQLRTLYVTEVLIPWLFNDAFQLTKL